MSSKLPEHAGVTHRAPVQIRLAAPGDLAGLASLLAEHERHYGHEPAAGAAEAGAAWLLSMQPGSPFTLVAGEGDAGLLGFAISSLFFPAARLTKGLFLKELYVSAAARGRGIGAALLDRLAALALQQGCSRIFWTTNPGNDGAQRLYDRLGARREGKVYYVLDGALLQTMAGNAR